MNSFIKCSLRSYHELDTELGKVIGRLKNNLVLVITVYWKKLCKEKNIIFSMGITLLEKIKGDAKAYRKRL